MCGGAALVGTLKVGFSNDKSRAMTGLPCLLVPIRVMVDTQVCATMPFRADVLARGKYPAQAIGQWLLAFYSGILKR